MKLKLFNSSAALTGISHLANARIHSIISFACSITRSLCINVTLCYALKPSVFPKRFYNIVLKEMLFDFVIKNEVRD